jgi:hypothetical protein
MGLRITSSNKQMHCFSLLWACIRSRVGVWLFDGVWIECLDLLLLHAQLVVTSNTALQLIYTLEFTVTHTLGFSVFTSRILTTYFNPVIIPVTLQIPHVKSSLHRLTFKSQLNSVSSLLSHLPLPSQETPSVVIPAGLGSSLYSLKSDPTENTVSIFIAQLYLDCCLLISCRENLFTESLPRNERLLWLRFPAFRRHITIHEWSLQ